MTDTPAPGPEDSADALAAEYVLGVLALDERSSAEARIKADAGFAARVSAWENRLADLNVDFPELPAPDLLPAIERRLFPVAAPARPRRGLSWGFLGGIVTAVALALVVIMSQESVRDAPGLTATLTAEAQPLVFAARFNSETGTLNLTRTGGDGAAAGSDLELWVIGADGVPASLGLVRAADLTVTAPTLAVGQVLAVSLEPAGGSTTGAPTGPVLVTGVLVDG